MNTGGSKQAKFLKGLITVFDQSIFAYRNYLNGGKTFYFARELKLHNSRALKLLTENKALAEESLQDDIQSLITHYTAWANEWEKLASEKEHEPGDVFVFPNAITFPGQAAQNLAEAYKSVQ